MIEKITYSNKATVNIGDYENVNPLYTITREFEIPEGVDRLSYINTQIIELKTYVDNLIWMDFDAFDKKANEDKAKDHRFTNHNGLILPHVTCILTPDTPSIPNIDDHAELGNAWEATITNLFKTNEYKAVDFADKGKIKTTYQDIFKAGEKMLPEYRKIEVEKYQEPVLNLDFRYAGTLDYLGTYDFLYSIIDAKKTKGITPELREKYFCQMAAYCKCLEPEPEQMIILTPYELIVEGDIEHYFQKFLLLRGRYEQRFGK